MKPRILLITSGLAAGGSELQLTQLAVGLQRRGWRAGVISLQAGGIFREHLESEGVPVREIPTGRVAGPAALLRIMRAMRSFRPSIVHTQAFRANLWGRPAAAATGFPVVASVRATYSYLPRAYLPVERALAACCTYIVTPSCASSRYLVDPIGISAHKIVTIPNGVDTGLFSPRTDAGDFREHHGLSGRFVVLTAGRLVPQKNHAGLLRAVDLLAERVPRAALVVAGSGPLLDELREQAASRGTPALFIGELPRQELAQAMAASDAVALFSDFEGTPNAVLEAMAAGKPVVATAVDGVPEVIDDGVEGLLVPRGDVAAAAGALQRLACVPEFREELGAKARTRVLARHSIDVNVDCHVSLYRQVLASRAGRPLPLPAFPDLNEGGP